MKYIILVFLFASCSPIVKKQESVWTFQQRLDAAANCKKPQRDSLDVLKDSFEVKIAKIMEKNKNKEDYSKWKFDDLTDYKDLNMKVAWLLIEQLEYMRQEEDSIRAVN